MSFLFLRSLAVVFAVILNAAFGSQQLPSLSVPKCNSGPPASLDGLSLSNGSAPFPARTTITLCWTADNLVLEYLCQDDRILRNDFLECNSPMYNQEVVEAFIAPRGLQDPPNYLEVETTPYSALYTSHILNPFLNGTISHTLVACDSSGIEHFSSVDVRAQAWRALLAVPWTLINAAALTATAAAVQPGDEYRANFYRIFMLNNVSSCSASDCDYGAWSPTFHDPPSFHQPKFFGLLRLA